MILLNRTNLQNNITELRFVVSGDETLKSKNIETQTQKMPKKNSDFKFC